MVRAWRSDGGDEPASGGADGLRGVVEHVATGTSMPFHDVDELVTFLRSAPGDDAGD